MNGITGQKSLLLWPEQEHFAGILLGTEQAPRADKGIDRKKTDSSYVLTDEERKDSGKQMAMHT